MLFAIGFLALLFGCRSQPIPTPTITPSAQATPTSSPLPAPPLSPAPSISSLNSSEGFSSISGEVTSVEKALDDLGAKTVGQEIRIDLPADILFDFDQYRLRPDAQPTLEKLLTIVKAQPSDRPIRVEGHTDAIGNDAYNQTLSEKRATSVKQWLTDREIATMRIVAQGFGETRPIAPNRNSDGSDNPSGRQTNRRVQVILTRR